MRNGVHFATQFARATSLTRRPLATVFARELTMPARTALLAAIFLNARLTQSRIGAIVLGFIGVLVIIRPGLESFRTAALPALAAAFGYAITLTTAKRLTAVPSEASHRRTIHISPVGAREARARHPVNHMIRPPGPQRLKPLCARNSAASVTARTIDPCMLWSRAPTSGSS
jgi:hypothetical protein